MLFKILINCDIMKNERRYFICNNSLKYSKLRKWNKFYHLYFWKSSFAVECLHDISHPRQFLIRSLWDGHQVQAKVLDLCGHIRLSIVLVISDFFGMESTLKSLHDWAVHDKVPGLGGVGGQIESAVHVDVQTPVQVTHLGKGEESLWKS